MINRPPHGTLCIISVCANHNTWPSIAVGKNTFTRWNFELWSFNAVFLWNPHGQIWYIIAPPSHSKWRWQAHRGVVLVRFFTYAIRYRTHAITSIVYRRNAKNKVISRIKNGRLLCIRKFGNDIATYIWNEAIIRKTLSPWVCLLSCVSTRWVASTHTHTHTHRTTTEPSLHMRHNITVMSAMYICTRKLTCHLVQGHILTTWWPHTRTVNLGQKKHNCLFLLLKPQQNAHNTMLRIYINAHTHTHTHQISE